MTHTVIAIAAAILGIFAGLFIAWGVIYADRLDERRWVAEQRAIEAKHKAARARMLDEWDVERRARLAELGVLEADDPSEEEPASGQKLAEPDEPPSKDGGIKS